MKFSKRTYQLLELALREDIGSGDATSRLLIDPNCHGAATVLSRSSGIFCGEEIVRYLFQKLDRKIKIRFLVRDGKSYRRNQTLIEVSGNLRAILAAERTVLNFIGRLSGIAALTREFVKRVPRPVQILDTRKTTPLWRELEKFAVKTGGGVNHRMGLYDAVFIKENHRPYADFSKLRKVRNHFEIEVRNLKELNEALDWSPKVILFDNFKPRNLRKAVQFARQRNRKIILEASGGVNLKNAAAYAKTGVDRISVGALTHSFPCSDFSMLIKKG